MATKDIEEEEEMMGSIAVEQYWTDKWDNINEIEKGVLMHNYILKKYNLNSFGIYIYAMEYLIKSGSLNGLNESLTNIVSGKRFEKEAKDTEREVNTILLDTVARMLRELTEPEQEEISEELNKEELYDKPVLQRLFEAYKMVKKNKRMKDGLDVIKRALE